MRADLYLFRFGYAKSRAEARRLIDLGLAVVDGKTISKPAEEIDESVSHTVSVSESAETRYASRGGLKLEAALDAFSVSPEGRVALDIGASGGGFTDCMLRRGARMVYALDCGSGQLADFLRADSRVRVYENYNARFVLTKEGYFKKITFRSLQGNDEQKCKEGDEILNILDGENRDDLIFLTDQAQLYRAKADDFDTTKASALGDYLPVKLKMDADEKPILMNIQNEYPEKEHLVLLFANGKGVRISMSNYVVTGNRRRITSAYSSKSPVVAAFYEKEPMDILLVNSEGKGMVVKSTLIPAMATRTSGGVQIMTLKAGQTLVRATTDLSDLADGAKGLKKIKIPASGVTMN